MRNTALVIAATAAVASAQLGGTAGNFTCPKANQAYCVGDSLSTDIIVRCDANGVGQPGRCSDNLAGEPPVGNTPALCWQTSNTSGDAACEKNCVVYGGSGNFNGTFTLATSLCTPTFTATSTSASATATGSGGVSATTTIEVTQSTTVCPSSSPVGGGSSVMVSTSVYANTTMTTASATNVPTSGTATPVSPPSTTASTVATAAAVANRVGAGVGAIGLVAALLL